MSASADNPRSPFTLLDNAGWRLCMLRCPAAIPSYLAICSFCGKADSAGRRFSEASLNCLADRALVDRLSVIRHIKSLEAACLILVHRETTSRLRFTVVNVDELDPPKGARRPSVARESHFKTKSGFTGETNSRHVNASHESQASFTGETTAGLTSDPPVDSPVKPQSIPSVRSVPDRSSGPADLIDDDVPIGIEEKVGAIASVWYQLTRLRFTAADREDVRTRLASGTWTPDMIVQAIETCLDRAKQAPKTWRFMSKCLDGWLENDYPNIDAISQPPDRRSDSGSAHPAGYDPVAEIKRGAAPRDRQRAELEEVRLRMRRPAVPASSGNGNGVAPATPAERTQI